MSQDNLIKNQDNSLGNIFSNELLNPTFDLSIDYSEIFIDDFINNDSLKEIPIIKTLVAFVKTGISINQLFFTKKMISFIKEFNSGDIHSEKLLDFKNKIENDSSFRNNAVEQIMVFNDRFIQLQQSKISAQLLISYVNGFISFEDYINLNIFLERLHPKAYKLMQSIENLNYSIDDTFEGDRDWETESILLSSGLGTEPGDFWSGFKLSVDGINLHKYGIKPLLK